MGVSYSPQPTATAPRSKRFFKSPIGVKTAKLPRELDINEAVVIENYQFTEKGASKRKGVRQLATVAGDNTPSAQAKVNESKIVNAYNDGTDTIITELDLDTKTFSDKKTFSSSTADVDFAVFDKYVVATNGSESVGYYHTDGQFLDFTGQGTDLTVGSTLTFGGGATAKLLAQNDAGATGTLLLIDIDTTGGTVTGSISDGVGGDGTVSGSVYDFYTLANAPKALFVEIYQAGVNGTPFLMAGNIEDNKSRVQWSQGYSDVTILPFTTWSGGSAPYDPEDPGEKIFKVGEITAMLAFKTYLFVCGDLGSQIMSIDPISISTKITRDTAIKFQDKELIIKKNPIAIADTVYCATDSGLFAIQFVGIEDKVQFEITSVLDRDDLEDFNFNDTSIIYNGRDKIHFYFRKNSTTNNYGITYDLQRKKNTLISGKGANIIASCRIGYDLYGIDSREMSVYKMFSDLDDSGIKINTRILTKEFAPQNDLMSLFNVIKTRFRGVMGSSEKLNIKFITWDYAGNIDKNALKITWEGNNVYFAIEPAGIGKVGIGKTSYVPADKILSENYAWKRLCLRNISKYQIELTSSTFSTHEINFLEFIEEASANESFGAELS